MTKAALLASTAAPPAPQSPGPKPSKAQSSTRPNRPRVTEVPPRRRQARRRGTTSNEADDGEGEAGGEDKPDQLVPDPQVWREFGITSMTGWRWTNDPELGFPPPIKIRTRCFRSRRAIEAFKQALMERALREHRTKRGREEAADAR